MDFRLSRIWGFQRAMLAFVGDAHDGRLGLARSGDSMVCWAELWGASSEAEASPDPDRDRRGEVRRRFGAGSSIL